MSHSMSNQYSHKTSSSLILSKVCDIIVNNVRKTKKQFFFGSSGFENTGC